MATRLSRYTALSSFLVLGAAALTWTGLNHPAGAAPPPPSAGPHRIEVVETRVLVPGTGLPAGLAVQAANNNLDVVRHEGRVYFAFRTAPSHYASDQTAIQVVSSEDERTWRSETRLHVGADLREPRLLSWDGTLFLYAAQLGTNRFDFEPDRTLRIERSPGGVWSEPTTVRTDGFIPWRMRIDSGKPLLIGYSGGGSLYDVDPGQVRVELLASDDGRSWRPVGARSDVLEGGGSETDVARLPDGGLVAVVRNELGDGSGWGSKICRAPAGDPGAWTCSADPRKFDSPLLFVHDGEVYLLARRSVSETGGYDLHLRVLPDLLQRLAYEINSISERKRCALWRYRPETQGFGFVLDLPSRGDTCFPAALSEDVPGELAVYDYSSDLAGDDDPSWVIGQHGKTFIYRHLLRFTRREPGLTL